MNKDCIGRVCIVMERIGLENTGYRTLDKNLLERIKLNCRGLYWKGHDLKWLDCKKIEIAWENKEIRLISLRFQKI